MFPIRQFSVKVWCYIVLGAILLIGAIYTGTTQATQTTTPTYFEQMGQAKKNLELILNKGKVIETKP